MRCRGLQQRKKNTAAGHRIIGQCSYCGKRVEKLRSKILAEGSLRKNMFCSRACAGRHQADLLKQLRRSQCETLLANLIRADFPHYTVLQNNRKLLDSGLEIDIFVVECKLAIELNGPCHYINIWGEDKLKDVQQRDAAKHVEIQRLGWPFVLLYTPSMTKKKQAAFVQEQYLCNIKPLLINSRPTT